MSSRQDQLHNTDTPLSLIATQVGSTLSAYNDNEAPTLHIYRHDSQNILAPLVARPVSSPIDATNVDPPAPYFDVDTEPGRGRPRSGHRAIRNVNRNMKPCGTCSYAKVRCEKEGSGPCKKCIELKIPKCPPYEPPGQRALKKASHRRPSTPDREHSNRQNSHRHDGRFADPHETSHDHFPSVSCDAEAMINGTPASSPDPESPASIEDDYTKEHATETSIVRVGAHDADVHSRTLGRSFPHSSYSELTHALGSPEHAADDRLTHTDTPLAGLTRDSTPFVNAQDGAATYGGNNVPTTYPTSHLAAHERNFAGPIINGMGPRMHRHVFGGYPDVPAFVGPDTGPNRHYHGLDSPVRVSGTSAGSNTGFCRGLPNGTPDSPSTMMQRRH